MEYGLFPFETTALEHLQFYYRNFTFNAPTALVFIGQADTFPAIGRVLNTYDTENQYNVKVLIGCNSVAVQGVGGSRPVDIDCYGVFVFPPGTYYINQVNPLFSGETSVNGYSKFVSATGNEESFLDIITSFRYSGTGSELVRFDFNVPGRLSVAFLSDETRADQYIREHRSRQFVQAAVGFQNNDPSGFIIISPTISSRLSPPTSGISGAGNVPILMGQSFSVDTPNRVVFYFGSSAYVKPLYIYRITWRGRII